MKRVYLISAIVVSICTTAITLFAGTGFEDVDKKASYGSISPPTSRIQSVSTIALTQATPDKLATSATVDSKPLSCFVPKRLVVAAAGKRKTKVAATVAAPAPPVSPRSFNEPLTGMEFLPVPAGCFQMGTSTAETDEMPLRQVCLDGFFIGKYEVTQGQWLQIMENNPSFFSSCGNNCPVDNVSWNDVQEFVGKLNSQNGRNYRLLTEAEWEYACQSGGKSERFCGGADVDSVAWYDRNSNSKSHPVGEKRPNGLGIYDMSGNVWEWVSDLYQSPLSSQNVEGALAGSKRVMRGGSWYNDAKNVRALNRGGDGREHRSINLGFRIAYSAR